MTHLSKVATHATKLHKRNKREVFEIVEDMCRDNAPSLTLETQAILYKYFMMPMKTVSTAFNWVALAAGKEETRPYLNYVYCDYEHPDGHMMVATDGHRLHMCPAVEGMAQGFHDLNGQHVEVNHTYPDYSRIVPASGRRSIIWDLMHSKVVTVPGQGKPQPRYEFDTPNGPIYCDQGYFDAARQKDREVSIEIDGTDKGGPLKLMLEEQRIAVVMPVRMYGGVE